MRRLAIVEDNRITCEGIRDNIDWANCGIEIAGAFPNGRAALDSLRTAPADIVLSDIVMPVMDGLGLAKALAEDCPDTRVILISAYDEFAYAQSALRFGVFDYVLKPFEYSVLKETILNTVRHMEADEGRRGALRYEKHYPAELESAFIHAVTTGNQEAADLCIDRLKDYFRDFAVDEAYAKTIVTVFHAKISKVFGDMLPEPMDIRFTTTADTRPANAPGIQPSHAADTRPANADGMFENLRHMAHMYCKSGASLSAQARAVAAARNHICREYARESLSLDDIARAVALSPVYLSAVYKRETNENIMETLRRVRIEHAKELLFSGMSVYEAAAASGFASQFYFSTSFKKYTGQTPSEFQRNSRRK